MDNPYFTNVNPYFQQLSPQDQALLNPSFQNIGSQQANQNAALQQQNQQVQQAGQTTPQGGSNALALAQLLRKSPNQQLVDKYGANNVYTPNGMGAQAPAYPTGMDY